MKNLESNQTDVSSSFPTTPNHGEHTLQCILQVILPQEFKHKIPFQLQHIHMLTDECGKDLINGSRSTARVTYPHHNQKLCLWLQATSSNTMENFLIMQLIYITGHNFPNTYQTLQTYIQAKFPESSVSLHLHNLVTHLLSGFRSQQRKATR
jgi:hypothetical protein